MRRAATSAFIVSDNRATLLPQWMDMARRTVGLCVAAQDEPCLERRLIESDDVNRLNAECISRVEPAFRSDLPHHSLALPNLCAPKAGYGSPRSPRPVFYGDCDMQDALRSPCWWKKPERTSIPQHGEGTPGNIRELQNVLERSVILTNGNILHLAMEPELVGKPASLAPGPVERAESQQAEREQILRALEKANRRVGGPDGAAAQLGLNRTTLQSRMRKLNISRQFR